MKRPSSFFEAQNKNRKELGVVEYLFDAMEKHGKIVYQFPKNFEPDPPDCIAQDLKGRDIGIEVRELTSQQAIEVTLKGDRVYRDWKPADVITQISSIIKVKDEKRFNGGPYYKKLLIIYTDEMVLSFNEYEPILNSLSC